MTVIPLVFDRYVNVAAGVASVIGGAAIIGFPYVFESWISGLGCRTALVCLACMALQGAVMAALISPSQMRRKQTVTPESCHHLMKKTCSLWSLSLYIASALGSLPLLIFQLLAPDQAVQAGFNYHQAYSVISIAGMGSVIGRCLVALTGKYTRGSSVLIITLALVSRASVIVFPSISSYWSLVTLAVVIGLGWGIQATLVSTAVAEAFDLQLLPGILAFRFVSVGLSSYVALPFAGEQNSVVIEPHLGV